MKKLYSLLILAILIVSFGLLPLAANAETTSDCPTEVSDGTISACRDSVFKDLSSGVEFVIKVFNSIYVDLDLTGVKNLESLRIYKRLTRTMISDSNYELTVSYKGPEANQPDLANLEIESREVADLICGDSVGNGPFSGCIGDDFDHNPSGIMGSVRFYNEKRLSLVLGGATKARVLMTKGYPRKVTAKDGTVYTFLYLGFDDSNGAMFEIE